MADVPERELMRRIGPALLRADAAARPDAELLERFARERDEEAFAELVRRHGPRVLGVCRRMLGNHHDAEECFQAVFLVLARRAAVVRPREAVGNWLYGVAVRTARAARRGALRRRAREARAEPPTGTASESGSELREVLDVELARLPEKYRAPLVLCDLEGLPRPEAAGRLGVAEGTLSSRLARGRALLADRLARRGIATAAVAAWASGEAACGVAPATAVPGELVADTVRSALGFMAGGAVVTSPLAVTLAREVLRAMLMTKLRSTVAVVLAVLVAGAGVAFFASRPQAAEPPPAKEEPKKEAKAEEPRPKPADREKELKKEMLEAARKTYTEKFFRLQNRAGFPDDMSLWSRYWLEAQLDLATKKEERIAAYKDHLDRMKDLEKITTAFAKTGQGRLSDATGASYFRIQAELWLAREQGK